jgi:GGDEF domain-containing protein
MSWRPGQWRHLPRWQGGEDVAALRRQIAALVEEVGELGRLARTDPLTGLANRRGWDEQLDRELAQARR